MTDPLTAPRIVRSDIDVLGMVRRRWQHLVLGAAVGLTLAFVYWQITPPQYESSIEVLVGQRSSEATNRGTIVEGAGGSESVDGDELATHMRLFIAKKVLARAIELGGLDQFESLQAVRAGGASLIDHILDHVEVERGGEGSAEDAMVLRARYRGTDPEEAALVLSAIFASYKAYVENQGQDSSEKAVRLIVDASRIHERELHDADESYREFVRSVPALLEGDKVRDIHKERLADIESELNVVRSSLAESTSRLQVIELAEMNSRESGDLDHLALLSQKEVERLKFFLDMSRGGAQSEAFQAAQPMRQEVARTHYNRLLDLIQKERALSDSFGESHPLVEAARKEIDVTQSFLAQHTPDTIAHGDRDLGASEMLATYQMLLRNDIAELTKRQAVLLEESGRELKLAKQVESDFMKGNSLRAKLDRAQSRYNQVVLRLQELNLARSYAGFSTDVLASPESASRPVWPRVPIVLAIGCAGGLVLGLLLTLLVETLDSTFSGAEDLEQTVGAPVIAHVPRMDLRANRRLVKGTSLLDPSLICHHAPRTAEAEIYRVARTSLMIASRQGDVKTIMMTSAQPGDGKSTSISNLAISLAQAGKRVLIIDADMRRPMISKLFGVESGQGLSDCLGGVAEMSETVRPTEVAGLDLLPNGSSTAEPAELLESGRLHLLLQHASRAYDFVLIDAPPVLAVTDPAIIAPCVDVVLLTVRIVKNGRRAVEDAVRLLSDIQVSPASVIVNGIEKSVRTSYMYGGYSRSGYGYVGRYHQDYAANPPAGTASSSRASTNSGRGSKLDFDASLLESPSGRQSVGADEATEAEVAVGSDEAMVTVDAAERMRRPSAQGIGFPLVDSVTHEVSQS